MYTDTQQSRIRVGHVAVAVCCLMLGACSWMPKGESNLDIGIKERGVASWYGEEFHGKQAASGELFDMGALTAAHRTLPLGSMVKVTNLVNGKHVRVRINDRGPYVTGRILDLSMAAAERLGMVRGGLSVIQIDVIGDRRPESILAAEESAPAGTALVSMQQLRQPEMRMSQELTLAHPDPAMVPVAHLGQMDMLMPRRPRGIGAMLAADHTAHTENVALILS